MAMLPEIILTPEWDLQPPHITHFARQVCDNFAQVAAFLSSVRCELAQTRISQDKLAQLEQDCQMALNTALKVQFQTEQKHGYLQLQLEKFQQLLEDNNQNYNRRLDDLALVITEQGKLWQHLSGENVRALEDTLAQRQSDFDRLKAEMVQQQAQAKEMVGNYMEQIKYFFEKQTIYSQDFAGLQKEMADSCEKVRRLSLEVDSKLQNFEQNYFVSLTARILQCEGKIQRSEGFSTDVVAKQYESVQQIQQLAEASKGQQAEQLAAAETLSWLKNEINKMQAKSESIFANTYALDRKINVFRADIGDLLDQEVGSRQTESAALASDVYRMSERVGDIQDELLRKINFCNDFAVNSGLQREFNACRLYEYEQGLDGVFEEGCLEVGQVKLLKAVTLRLRELENRFMQLTAQVDTRGVIY